MVSITEIEPATLAGSQGNLFEQEAEMWNDTGDTQALSSASRQDAPCSRLSLVIVCSIWMLRFAFIFLLINISKKINIRCCGGY